MEIKSGIVNESMRENKIVFSEPFYLSTDKKTIMGEAPFSQILFLEYRETEAGSNPREYTGLKKANEAIIKSLLKDYKNMFRFLHSGVIVSLVNPVIKKDSLIIKYDDCCLTNGNQTRFIILLLTLLKMFFSDTAVRTINRTEFKDFIRSIFDSDIKETNVLPFVKYQKVNEMINFLLKNNKYLRSFNDIKLKDFLNSRIRIQVNLINSIVDDLEDELDAYTAGTFIAEANNDTQKVKADDIFGNKYKKDLEERIFNNFIGKYGDKIRIEYRLGEIVEKGDKVHILTLLRLVVATGILTKEKDIFRLTNQRDPIYKLFERVLRSKKNEKTIEAISKLIPLL